ncbi:hypothetical protein [Polaromonas glacialis]|uniref:hypothetical protein n=1 Tax=Polaromonas glacialis TaxID=866564 RepID=UPI0004951C5F|nr:hypothetical protein [Polaromonas glacialis]
MAILTEDIKLLKSAVMADVPEGGGAMTGVVVIDGQSNNLVPDTSAVNRALGVVNARKLFGVAHTSDTDTLMGAHAMVTQAPADPLVHCTLMETANWADTRAVAQDSIEKYLVKGPRLVFRLWDTHYAGSLLIKLISMVEGTAPAGGDAIVLRNPNGDEQYVRILRVSTATQQVAVTENGSTVLVNATVATCDIGNPLERDIFGPPALRVGLNEALYAQAYSTNIAGGAKFYGIKPLASAGAPGDYSVMASGGIYTPVVPAATVESPIIDLYPLKDRTGIVPTAMAPLALQPFTTYLGAGVVLTTPTPIAPGTLSLVSVNYAFTDDRIGNLVIGTLVVGTVDYKLGKIAFGGASPQYGQNILQLTYSPATVAPMANHSSSMLVTIANQGRSFVNAFEPAPAPGSFTLSYMAQARWYDLTDNGSGKIGGADSSYGAGTLDSATGSMGVTLGAVPDVGSLLIADWGDKTSATAIESSRLPLRLGARLPLPAGVGGAITMTWARAGVTYNAAIGVDGQVTGDATGWAGGGVVNFEPNVFPAGPVSMSGVAYANRVDTVVTPVTNPVAYTYQANAASLPIAEFTFAGKLAVTTPPYAVYPASVLDVFDRRGKLFARYHGNKEDGIANNNSELLVGTINYATGQISLRTDFTMFMWYETDKIPQATGWVKEVYKSRSLVQSVVQIAAFGALSAPDYHAGATTQYVTTYETVSTQTPVTNEATATAWTGVIGTGGVPLLVSNLAFKLGSDNYTVKDGVLRRGWNPLTGAPLVASAGTLTSDGVITVAMLPDNFTNGFVWANAAQDASAKLVGGGVFRTASAPLKTGVMQLQSGTRIANANESGVLSGGSFTGSVDFQRGVVKWASSPEIPADSLSYNAVFLQYLPLDKDLLGIDTVRLPLDGRVPIFRTGDLVVVHNTLTMQLPNPLVKGTAYPLGRERLASVRVKDSLGVLVPSSLYVSDLNPGTITVPAESTITGYSQPLTVEHRIEDMVVCSLADISGQLKFTRSLTHDFPANTSFVSSALTFGDLFARCFNYIEQTTWTGAWSDALIGAAPAAANFNEGQYPAVTTNRGAITERWALIFTSNLSFRIVGESVGDIGTSSTSLATAPINPATGAPYFTLPASGWGNGWSAGNVLRFNTAACGAPFWVVRTVLQGPATLNSDVFSIAFRGDVDRP